MYYSKLWMYYYRLHLDGRAVFGRSLAGIAGSNSSGGMDDCFLCFVLSDRGLCDGPITRPECVCVCVCVCDQV